MHVSERLLIMFGFISLAGCSAPMMGPGNMGMAEVSGAPSTPSAHGKGVVLLVPLTGLNGDLGKALVNAARLGFGTGTVPPLVVIDTGGTPAGAADAARRAIADDAGLILGPLTSQEARATAPITSAAHIDVLAFTSDSSGAQPGFWAIGITPAQQVHALLGAAKADGHGQIAGLLPLTPLGTALDRALRTSEPASPVQFYTDFASMNDAARVVSDYADRRGPVDARIKQLQSEHTIAAQSEVARLARQPIPPPSFNALLIAETGTGLGELRTLLPYYDVNPGSILILGPGLWAANPSAVAAAGFSGALYAAPDPAAAQNFDSRYDLAFGAAPPPLAAIAFDAGGIARLATQAGGVDRSVLTNRDGFAGADGVLALQPDGSVRRGLAIFRIQPDGAHIVQPAPQTVPATGI